MTPSDMSTSLPALALRSARRRVAFNLLVVGLCLDLTGSVEWTVHAQSAKRSTGHRASQQRAASGPGWHYGPRLERIWVFQAPSFNVITYRDSYVPITEPSWAKRV